MDISCIKIILNFDECVLSVFPKSDVLTDFNGPVPDQPEPRVCHLEAPEAHLLQVSDLWCCA